MQTGNKEEIIDTPILQMASTNSWGEERESEKKWQRQICICVYLISMIHIPHQKPTDFLWEPFYRFQPF